MITNFVATPVEIRVKYLLEESDYDRNKRINYFQNRASIPGGLRIKKDLVMTISIQILRGI